MVGFKAPGHLCGLPGLEGIPSAPVLFPLMLDTSCPHHNRCIRVQEDRMGALNLVKPWDAHAKGAPALELPVCAAVFVAWLILHSPWAKFAELALSP